MNAEHTKAAATQAWERQRGERVKAFRMFQIYRDLGPERSLAKLAEHGGNLTPSRRQLQRWSSKYRWVERCRHYDNFLDAELRKRNEKERAEMAERHARLAAVGLNQVIRQFNAWATTGVTLTPDQAARWASTFVEIERLSRGAPTEIQAAELSASVRTEAPDYSKMSDEELREDAEKALRQIMTELGYHQSKTNFVMGLLLSDDNERIDLVIGAIQGDQHALEKLFKGSFPTSPKAGTDGDAPAEVH
jgi:hypothetical protein